MIYNEIKQHGTGDFPIELYHVEHAHPRYEMSAHWHNEIEIIRVIGGVLHVRLNNNSYMVKSGEIIFVNPETVHQASPEDCVYECLVFDPDVLPAFGDGTVHFVESLKEHEYLVDEYLPDSTSAVSEAVNNLFEAMGARTAGYKYKVVGAMYHLFGEIMDAGQCRLTDSAPLAADRNVPKLRTVLSYIRSNYDTSITLEDMAAAAGMSPKYFCNFFREMTTKTPVEYLTLYRIEEASRKLIKSDKSVTAIAYSCGFNDLSYFIKTFKQVKGITPAKFRKASLS